MFVAELLFSFIGEVIVYRPGFTAVGGFPEATAHGPEVVFQFAGRGPRLPQGPTTAGGADVAPGHAFKNNVGAGIGQWHRGLLRQQGVHTTKSEE